ncbi:hypothetical protein [Streptomyces sp. NPDC001876]|uniref:hypothetical protein n=1 Tax=Streptomyces sp. NPDC001876 TaxID=3154402 RepID=UPI00331E3633
MPQTEVQVPSQQAVTATAAQPAPARAPGPRLHALDALRVVAALAVLAFHFTGVDAATKANWG